MNHSHVLYDSDPHFKIDPITRRITNESSAKTTIIQHDHNSERFTFEVPRYIEGHDLSLCNVVEVHYLNIESNSKNAMGGVYTVDDLQVKVDDENTVVCSWLVGSNATRLVGQLQFLIRFSCADEETGLVDYVWNTAPYSGITISSGIYNGDTSSDNAIPAFNFVTTINGEVLKFFVGTQEEYNRLSGDDRQGLLAVITDDKTREEITAEITAAISALQTGIEDGTVAVAKATQDGNGNNIADTYATKSALTGGSITVAKASSADSATNVATLQNNAISNYSTVVSFSIGDKSFSHTVDRVTNAKQAESASVADLLKNDNDNTWVVLGELVGYSAYTISDWAVGRVMLLYYEWHGKYRTDLLAVMASSSANHSITGCVYLEAGVLKWDGNCGFGDNCPSDISGRLIRNLRYRWLV